MGDQPKFTSSEAQKPRTGLPKDDALYDEDKNVSINDSDRHDARTYDASFPPPEGVTPSPLTAAMILESEYYQSRMGDDEKYQTEPRKFTSDTAFCHALSRVSLTRDKSGGSISTTQSDEVDDWKDMIELPDSLSRCSLFRDMSGCSSIVTRQSVPSARGPEENASALGPMSSHQTDEPLTTVCTPSDRAHSKKKSEEEYCTERLERLRRPCQGEEDQGNVDGQNASKPIPGYNSRDDFKMDLFFGTSCSDTPKINTADSVGAIGSHASTVTWPCSNNGLNGRHPKSCGTHTAFPIHWTSAPDGLAPLNSYLSRERRFVQEQPRFSARAEPTFPLEDKKTSPMRKNEANNAVFEERNYVLDGCQANDVPCGKGEAVNQHPGHKLFHKVKLDYQDHYRRTNIKKEKSALAEKLLNTMARKHGSRFLAFCPEIKQWYVISHERAMLKAKQVLRENFTAEQRRLKREKYKATKKCNSRKSQK